MPIADAQVTVAIRERLIPLPGRENEFHKVANDVRRDLDRRFDPATIGLARVMKQITAMHHDGAIAYTTVKKKTILDLNLNYYASPDLQRL